MNRDEVMTFVKKSLSFLPDKSYIKLYYQLRVNVFCYWVLLI